MNYFTKERKSASLTPLILILSFWLLSTSTLAIEPSIRFEHLSVEDGLPNSSISCSLQDSQGFIWFGTQNGLARFDGISFKIYKNNQDNPQSLSSNYIKAITEDQQGNIWVGTDSGLNHFNPKTEQFTHYRSDAANTNSLSHDSIMAITGDQQGNIWVGTDGSGLNRFNPKTKQFTHYRYDTAILGSVSHDRITAITEDQKGNLWVGTWGGGLNRFNSKTEQFSHYRFNSSNSNSLSHDYVWAITEDQHGNLWIGTNGGGLNLFNPRSEKFSHFRYDETNHNSLSHDIIRAITIDRQGDLWLATYGGGLNRFNPEIGQFSRYLHSPANPNSLSHDSVWTIMEDQQSNLWVGTWGGLNRYNPKTKQFSHYRHDAVNPSSLSHDSVWAIMEDQQGNLWVGTDKGLNSFNPKNELFTHYRHDKANSNSLSQDEVVAVTEDQQGNIWAGTWGGGLNYINPRTKQFTHYRFDSENSNSLSHDFVWAITEDQHGNLWIGTNGGGLNRFNPKTEQFTHYRHDAANLNSLSHDNVMAITEDQQGNLWVGTDGGGLNQFNPEREQFVHYRYDAANSSSLSHDSVRDITEDHEGNIWIGTGNGVTLLDKKTGHFKRYYEKDGLASNVIGNILQDNAGMIWISTINGLSRLNPGTQQFKNYDVGDGLQSNAFNIGAAIKANSGELFFGGNSGFNRFLPENIKEDFEKPKIVLTDMLLLNQSVTINDNSVVAKDEVSSPLKPFTLDKAIHLTSEITLTHLENLMSFEFSALHFTNPKKIQYAYQLEGWNDKWIKTDYKNRRATYTNLPGGEYVLRVKAANPDGVWNEQGASLKITILPPPWKTGWAYSLYTLVLLGFVWYFIRSQRQKVVIEKSMNRLLEHKVSVRTGELEMLGDIGKELNASLSMETIFERLYMHISKIVDTHVFTLGLINQSKQCIDFKYSIEGGKRLPFHVDYLNDKLRLSVWCVLNKKEVVTQREEDEKNYIDTISEAQVGESMESVVYLPMMTRANGVIGCVSLQSPKQNAYTKEQLNIIRTLASYTAIAIDNASGYGLLTKAHNDLSVSHAELKNTQTQLVQAEKMAGLGTLTAGVAHEINNPTNFTHAAVYMMKDEISEIKTFLIKLAGGDKADPEIVKSFDQKFAKLIDLTHTATEGTKRVKMIVDDLRTFTRLDEAERQQVHVAELIQSTVHLVRTQYDAIELKIQLNFNPLIRCFPSKLNQVLMNLMINACQAVESRKQQQPDLKGQVVITSEQENDQIKINVADNGCGMKEATKNKIFEPFFTTKEVGKGTGLGMAISFGIIEEHGGTIQVESTLGEGSVITLSLPS